MPLSGRMVSMETDVHDRPASTVFITAPLFPEMYARTESMANISNKVSEVPVFISFHDQPELVERNTIPLSPHAIIVLSFIQLTALRNRELLLCILRTFRAPFVVVKIPPELLTKTPF